MTGTTWNPSDKSANITLSNGNLTAAASASSNEGVRAVDSKTSGKYYFEWKLTGTPNGSNTGVEVCREDATLSSMGSTTNLLCGCFISVGNIWNNGSFTGKTVGAFATNDVGCSAIDLDNKRAWFRKNGGNWNGDATANPATNTGGIDISGWFTGVHVIYPSATFNTTTSSFVTNFGDSSFTQTTPSGFTSGWPTNVTTGVGASSGVGTATGLSGSIGASTGAGTLSAVPAYSAYLPGTGDATGQAGGLVASVGASAGIGTASAMFPGGIGVGGGVGDGVAGGAALYRGQGSAAGLGSVGVRAASQGFAFAEGLLFGVSSQWRGASYGAGFAFGHAVHTVVGVGVAAGSSGCAGVGRRTAAARGTSAGAGTGFTRWRGPFYFAWADPGEPWSILMLRQDEQVIHIDINHKENESATLEIKIRNPRVGLLAPGRRVWCWITWFDGSTYRPLINARLVGIPSDILGNAAVLQFIARPEDFVQQKTVLADSLKVLPFWDPVFVSEDKRSDPNSVLEGYARYWHVDRVTLGVTVSDILVGEDGVVVFDSDKALYDSVRLTIGETPLREVFVDAKVKWRQQAKGWIDMGAGHFVSWDGSAIVGSWPKPRSDLGGGWSCFYGFASDSSEVAPATVKSELHFKNTEKVHANGDTMSLDIVVTEPAAPCSGGVIKYSSQIVIGDPETGRAASAQYNDERLYALISTVSTGLILQYDADRARTERVSFVLSADIQPITVEPDVGSDVLVLTPQGVDVSEPLVDVPHWVTFAGRNVIRGQVVITDPIPGETGVSYQLALTTGFTGPTEPIWENTVALTTQDNAVTWICIGGSLNRSIDFWRNIADTTVELGQIIQSDDRSTYQICTQPGNAGRLVDALGNLVNVNGLYVEPPFSPIPGVQTVDNTVVWTSLGTQGTFAYIPIGDISRRSYFPTDRGLQSLGYLICLAAAALKKRSRAVKVEWEAPFGMGVNLSCRKNAQVFDLRLPGGQATGKIVEYSLVANVESGKFRTRVTIMCAIGNGGSVVDESGTPLYVTDGYVQPGYQAYDSSVVALLGDDIGFTPPQDAPVDDGLVFPLTKSQAVIYEATKGGGGPSPVDAALDAARGPASRVQYPSPTDPNTITITDPASAGASALASAVKNNPVYYEFVLAPVTEKTFDVEYNVVTTPLKVAKLIDMEAPSS
jgi:hypothetical protein